MILNSRKEEVESVSEGVEREIGKWLAIGVCERDCSYTMVCCDEDEWAWEKNQQRKKRKGIERKLREKGWSERLIKIVNEKVCKVKTVKRNAGKFIEEGAILYIVRNAIN